MILLDTNILVRYAKPIDPLFPVVESAINLLLSRDEDLCLVAQNFYEFWTTATRPVRANGLDLSILECQTQIDGFKQVFRILPDHPTLFEEWESLVGKYACHGRVSFDARLVAAMRTLGITTILTLNVSDFVRFPNITVLDPRTIANTP